MPPPTRRTEAPGPCLRPLSVEREGSGEGKSQRDDSGALTRRGRNRRTSEKQQAGSGLDIWVNFWVTQSWAVGTGSGEEGWCGGEGGDLGRVGLWFGGTGPGAGGEVSGGCSFGAQESREVVGSLGRAARATLAGAEPGEGPQEPGSLPAPRLLQSRQLPRPGTERAPASCSGMPAACSPGLAEPGDSEPPGLSVPGPLSIRTGKSSRAQGVAGLAPTAVPGGGLGGGWLVRGPQRPPAACPGWALLPGPQG